MNWGTVANVSITIVSLTITLLLRPLFMMLMSMRDDIRMLRIIVTGADGNPVGLLQRMTSVETKVQEHHDFIVLHDRHERPAR